MKEVIIGFVAAIIVATAIVIYYFKFQHDKDVVPPDPWHPFSCVITSPTGDLSGLAEKLYSLPSQEVMVLEFQPETGAMKAKFHSQRTDAATLERTIEAWGFVVQKESFLWPAWTIRPWRPAQHPILT